LPAFIQHAPLTVHRALAHAQLAPIEIGLLVVGEIPYLALAAALGAAVQGEGFGFSHEITSLKEGGKPPSIYGFLIGGEGFKACP